MRIDGHLGRSGFAGADGPDGLVGDDDGRGSFSGDAREGAGDLRLEHLFGFARFALGENFTDADDGNDAVLERGVQFLVDDLVGLGEVLAALGVADERVRPTDGDELTDGGFAGIGAFFSKVDVLAADGNIDPLAAAMTVGSRTGDGNRAISSRV